MLIVEDELEIGKAYSEELIGEGFIVLTATNGKDGLAIALREEPDIILSDIQMPVMDGLTMMNTLRETNQYGKDVPIILLTNLSINEEKAVQAVTKNRPIRYLVKSDWSLSRVINEIEACLAQMGKTLPKNMGN